MPNCVSPKNSPITIDVIKDKRTELIKHFDDQVDLVKDVADLLIDIRLVLDECGWIDPRSMHFGLDFFHVDTHLGGEVALTWWKDDVDEIIAAFANQNRELQLMHTAKVTVDGGKREPQVSTGNMIRCETLLFPDGGMSLKPQLREVGERWAKQIGWIRAGRVGSER